MQAPECWEDHSLPGQLCRDDCSRSLICAFSNVLLLAPGQQSDQRLVAQSRPVRNSQTWLFCSVSFGGPNSLERTRALLLSCGCFVNTRINFLFFLLTRAFVISVVPAFVQQPVKRGRFSAKFYPFPDKHGWRAAGVCLRGGLFVFRVLTGLLWLFNLIRDLICGGGSFTRHGCR